MLWPAEERVSVAVEDGVWLVEKAHTEEGGLQSIRTQCPGDTENRKSNWPSSNLATTCHISF